MSEETRLIGVRCGLTDGPCRHHHAWNRHVMARELTTGLRRVADRLESIGGTLGYVAAGLSDVDRGVR